MCSKKGHSQKYGIPSKVYDEEWVHICPILMLDFEISDLSDFSYAILGSVYVVDGSGIGEVLGGDGEMVDYFWRNEIFGHTTIN